MLHRREKRHNKYFGVVVCLLLSMALGALHNRAAAAGRADLITSSVRTLTSPLVLLTSGVGRWLGRQAGWIFHGKSTDNELRKLKLENDRLRDEVARLREAEITVARLRAQIGFAATVPPEKLPADIVSLRPIEGFENIVISRGGRSGVRIHDVVV